MQAPKLTITRRTLVRGAIGAGVVAGIAGVNGVMHSRKNVTLSSELTIGPQSVVTLDTFTQLDEPGEMMHLLDSVDLPYHSLAWMSDEGILAYLTPTKSGHPLNAVGVVRFGGNNVKARGADAPGAGAAGAASGAAGAESALDTGVGAGEELNGAARSTIRGIQKPQIVLSQAHDNAEGFDIYDVRASRQGIIWLEAHVLTNTWRVWCARFTKTGIDQPLLLDEGTQYESMPTLGIIRNMVFWQIDVPLRKSKEKAQEGTSAQVAASSTALAAATLGAGAGGAGSQTGTGNGANGSGASAGGSAGNDASVRPDSKPNSAQSNKNANAHASGTQASVSCIRSAFLPGEASNAVRCFRESKAGFVTSLGVSNNLICAAERMQQSRSHTRLVALDTSGTLVDSLVLPAGIRPVNIAYGKSGFTFGIEGSYKNKTGITKLGTYFPLAVSLPQVRVKNGELGEKGANQVEQITKAEQAAQDLRAARTGQAAQTAQAERGAQRGAGNASATSEKHALASELSYAALYNASTWFHFGRTPTTAPCWCDDMVIVKSTYSVLAIDLRAKNYVMLPVDSGADQWGEWCASSGNHATFVTFTSINDKPIGKEPVRVCRVKVWEKA